MNLRLRFRVRHVLLLTTVFATVMGMISWRVRQFKEKNTIVEKLESLCVSISGPNGTVLTKGDGIVRDDDVVYFNEPSKFSTFLRVTIGDFSSLDVIDVSLGYADTNERRDSVRELIDFLAKFPSVKAVDFGGHCVNDQELAVLVQSCPQLTHVIAMHGAITDKSVPSLARLAQLEVLELPYNRLSGIGFREIAASCKQLKRLDLRFNPMTKNGLEEICQVRSLERLDVGPTGIEPGDVNADDFTTVFELLESQGVFVGLVE
jgi:hypothetical protein